MFEVDIAVECPKCGEPIVKKILTEGAIFLNSFACETWECEECGCTSYTCEERAWLLTEDEI